MNDNTSTYLDFLRVSAAMLVFFEHFSLGRISGGKFDFIGNYGHEAVMVFFVLSGYVIAYVVSREGSTFKKYIISRFARLYSVLIPVLVLGFIIDSVGNQINPSIYEGKVALSQPLLRFLFNGLYLQELWSLNVRYGSNGPLWSLCYEFWYYVIFAAAYFMKRSVLKYTTLVTLIIFVGPKVIVLFPIWLLGVLAYYANKKIEFIPITLSITLFLGSIGTYILLQSTSTLDLIADYSKNISLTIGNIISVNPAHASEFLRDYIVGLLVSINIFSSKYLWRVFSNVDMPNLIKIFRKTVKHIASMTYSLYLFHFPLLLFLIAATPYSPANIIHNILLIGSSLIIIYLLSQFTERKKNKVKNWLELSLFKPKYSY